MTTGLNWDSSPSVPTGALINDRKHNDLVGAIEYTDSMANKELGNMALCIEDDAWEGLDKSIMATSRCCSCRASCAHSSLHTSSELL